MENADRDLSFGTDFSFIVLADTHIKDKDSFGFEKLKTVIDESNGKIKFVVVLGDITQNGEEDDLKEFLRIARSFGVPCYPVIGNHDIYFRNWDNWKNLIGSTSYKINGDTATLFILDSANAFFGKEQLDWLENELKSLKGRGFVFTHSNLFGYYQQLTDTNERARIMSILQNKCDIMFMGHSHARLIREAGGVKYINIEDFKGNDTYVIVSVDNAGVSYEFAKLNLSSPYAKN